MRTSRQGGVSVRPALAKQRQHTVAQEVAVMAVVRIAGILDPAQAMLPGVGVQGGAGGVQQRAPQVASVEGSPLLHRTKSIRAGTSQGAEQEGFRLIVEMVGEREDGGSVQRRGKCTLSGRARCPFKAEAG